MCVCVCVCVIGNMSWGLVIFNACPRGVRSCLGGAFINLSPGEGGGVIINACPDIFSWGVYLQLLSFVGVDD